MQANNFIYLALIPALPLAGALINLLFGRSFPRWMTNLVALGSVAGAFSMVVRSVFGALVTERTAYMATVGDHADGQFEGLFYKAWEWIHIGSLKIDLAFRMDTLTAVMCLLITFVGFLIHLYSTGYMKDDPRYTTFFGYLNLFTGSMLILVLGDNLPVMFIGWEGVGLCSYLLIGFWYTEEANATAGRKAFIVNRVGDFGFLLGIFVLFWATGEVDFFALKSAALTTGDAAIYHTHYDWLGGEKLAMLAGILLFIGACGKSAQIPLYVWLPDAMAGPTPVSALIHAATMVTAGVYMVARLSFLYASSATAMAIVAGVGALTALVAAFMAFAQTDLKKVLAYSTVSQLGFMFVGVGTGAWAAGIFHLVTHGFFKAGLFLGAGSVMHAMSGSGDIMKMGGLRSKLPFTHASFLIYCFAIAGIVPFSGFFSKDEILAGAYAGHVVDWWPMYGKVLWIVLTVAAAGTAFYMFRLYSLVFSGECRADEETKSHIHESPWTMTLPLLVLAAATFVLGWLGFPHLESIHLLPNVFHEWLAASVAPASYVGGPEVHHLSDAQIIGLMAFALAIGAVFSFMAWKLYKNGVPKLVEDFTSGVGRPLYLASKNKLWVDELYEATVLRCFRWLARMFYRAIDRTVIEDVFVGGGSGFVDLLGRVARWFQNGQLQRYLSVVVIGAVVLFLYASRTPLDFDYSEVKPNHVVFTADVSAGASAEGAIYKWDFDGDGAADSHDAKAEWSFDQPGTYDVTLTYQDGLGGASKSLIKKVTVGAAQGGQE